MVQYVVYLELTVFIDRNENEVYFSAGNVLYVHPILFYPLAQQIYN